MPSVFCSRRVRFAGVTEVCCICMNNDEGFPGHFRAVLKLAYSMYGAPPEEELGVNMILVSPSFRARSSNLDVLSIVFQ